MHAQPALAPTAKADRISAIDTIRGVSVCGILLMNITGFGLYQSYEDPTVNGGATGLNAIVWWVNSVFFEGTMRGMFSVLFGAGIILFTGRSSDQGNTTDLYFRRLMWLILFGIIHCYVLLWEGEILYTYGLMGMLAFSFRHLAPSKLVIATIVFLSLATLWNVSDYFTTKGKYESATEASNKKSEGKTLTEEETEAITTWDEGLKARKPNKEKIDKEIAARHKGYFSIMMYTVPTHQYMQTMFVYRLGVFDTLAMMLLGMAFLKLGVLQASRSYRYYLLMALIGYAIGITVNYFETSHIVANQFSILSLDRSSMTYQVGRVANMCGHIALIMMFIKSAWLPFLRHSLAGWTDGTDQLHIAVVDLQFYLSRIRIGKVRRVATVSALLCRVRGLGLSVDRESGLVEVFSIRSDGMGLAEPHVLEEAAVYEGPADGKAFTGGCRDWVKWSRCSRTHYALRPLCVRAFHRKRPWLGMTI